MGRGKGDADSTTYRGGLPILTGHLQQGTLVTLCVCVSASASVRLVAVVVLFIAGVVWLV